MRRRIPLLAEGWLYSRLIRPIVPASSAYMDYFVVETQLEVLKGLCPSNHVNLNLNHYNIRNRVSSVLILLLFWLCSPFFGGGGPNQQADMATGDYLQPAFVFSAFLNSLAGTILVQSYLSIVFPCKLLCWNII